MNGDEPVLAVTMSEWQLVVVIRRSAGVHEDQVRVDGPGLCVGRVAE